VPVYSPRSNMFFEREEIRLMIGALIFLFPQFPKVRAVGRWRHTRHLDYYDQKSASSPSPTSCVKPENKRLLDWARPLAKRHAVLTQNTDYAFSGLFYQLLQFPLFSRFLSEEAVHGVDKGSAARNLAPSPSCSPSSSTCTTSACSTLSGWRRTCATCSTSSCASSATAASASTRTRRSTRPRAASRSSPSTSRRGWSFRSCLRLAGGGAEQAAHALDELLEDGGYLSKPRFEPLDHIKHFDFWRLFYTAFSRAQNLLVLGRAGKAMAGGASRRPSTSNATVLRAAELAHH
jgi:DNA helicase-2/ATP-dependent DNA helicase PcrA